MAQVLVASADRRGYTRIRREMRRLGWGEVHFAQPSEVKAKLEEGRVDLVVFTGSDPGRDVLTLTRWIRRNRPRTAAVLVAGKASRQFQSACEKLDLPCLLEPLQGPLLRACLLGAIVHYARPHLVDDLWFDVLDRIPRRAPRSSGSEI